MRGTKPSRLDYKVVRLVNKPYFGELGIVIGESRPQPRGKRRVRLSHSTGTSVVAPISAYRVMLLDPKWKDRVVKVRRSQMAKPEMDLSHTYLTTMGWTDPTMLSKIKGEHYAHDYVTCGMLHRGLVNRLDKIKASGLYELDLPSSTKEELLTYMSGPISSSRDPRYSRVFVRTGGEWDQGY